MIEGIDFQKLFFEFEGRATRKEYWVGVIALVITGILIGVIGKIIFSDFFEAMFLTILQLVILVPSFLIQVKRWHDRNKSAWWCLINLVPVIGSLWAFIELGFLASVDEGNHY